jgi:hypothetical protein
MALVPGRQTFPAASHRGPPDGAEDTIVDCKPSKATGRRLEEPSRQAGASRRMCRPEAARSFTHSEPAARGSGLRRARGQAPRDARR